MLVNASFSGANGDAQPRQVAMHGLVSSATNFWATYVAIAAAAASWSVAAGSPVCLLHVGMQAAGRGAVSRPARSGGWPADELSRNIERVEKEGDPRSARRVAELYELHEDDENARTWWHVAAGLGDPDAIDYVKEILIT
jgi:hypothetical protein